MVVELGYNAASQIIGRGVSNDSHAAPTAANAARGYGVNGLNQYTGTTWGGAPNWSFEYDPNGNLKRSVDPAGTDTISYLYDVENRLVAASGAASATLVYDPLGRLFEVAGAGGAKTRFLYDGDRMIAEYDGSGTLTRRYVHGPGADEPVAVYEGPELGLASRRYTMTDERGSIAALVNAGGTPSAINRYDAWGIPGAGNGGRFQYTGQAWIAELGLYYYKARFYSPWLGRFMQTDPIGYEGGVNFYVYVGNDPVNGTDPTGMYTCKESECGSVRKAVQMLGRAAENARMNNTGSRLPSEAARVLTAQVRVLGKEGEGSIHIENASLTSGRLGEYSRTDSGGHRIQLDFQQIRRAGGGPIAAATLGHEMTHAAQDTRHGPARTLEDLTLRERQAYRVGGWTLQALGWHSPLLPSMTDSRFEERVRAAAKDNCLASAIAYEDTHNRHALLPGNCQ